MDKLYSITAAAELIGATRQYIYKLHKIGKLPFVEIFGMRRVREGDLLKLVKPVDMPESEVK